MINYKDVKHGTLVINQEGPNRGAYILIIDSDGKRHEISLMRDRAAEGTLTAEADWNLYGNWLLIDLREILEKLK